jgi:hypothetical protein
MRWECLDLGTRRCNRLSICQIQLEFCHPNLCHRKVQGINFKVNCGVELATMCKLVSLLWDGLSRQTMISGWKRLIFCALITWLVKVSQLTSILGLELMYFGYPTLSRLGLKAAEYLETGTSWDRWFTMAEWKPHNVG